MTEMIQSTKAIERDVATEILEDDQLDAVSAGFEWFPVPPVIHSRS